LARNCFFFNQFWPFGSYVTITSTHSAAKSKYSITTPPSNTYCHCGTKANVFIVCKKKD